MLRCVLFDSYTCERTPASRRADGCIAGDYPAAWFCFGIWKRYQYLSVKTARSCAVLSIIIHTYSYTEKQAERIDSEAV